MDEKLISLPPILPVGAKVLILGSMPSGISLERQEYYGNPRNHFWDILFVLFNQENLTNYEEKVSFVKQHGIALWDTIGTCYREGSLDVNIVEEEVNDIPALLQDNPSIKLIMCNGTKSYQTFMKSFPKEELGSVEIIKMPSTSPIPGKYNKTFAGKVEDWKHILDYI